MVDSTTMRLLRPLLVLAALAVLTTACSDGAAPAPTAASETPLRALTGGDPLPSAVLPVLSDADDGATVATDDWVGTPTVVNFWATWCAFCVEEMPDFQTVHADLGDAVRFVGVDREDRRDEALDFVEAVGVTYDLVEDPEGDFFFATQARGMPTTLFVDADGVIQHRVAGALSEERLRELIDEHLQP